MRNIPPSQVTCVIPQSGTTRYLTEAVTSALAQGLKEVIVVNQAAAPETMACVATLPGVRLVHLPGLVGCGIARNIGMEQATTPYVVFLDHDDVLRPGYLQAISRFMVDHELRFAAGTLRYIGDDSSRPGIHVSRHVDFVLASGFMAEISVVNEAGLFPDSYSEDLIFFHDLRKIAPIRTCPDAGVFYRVHNHSGSNQSSMTWWALTVLLPLYYNGIYTLPEINHFARAWIADGSAPPGQDFRFQAASATQVKVLSRSAYACWLNRNYAGILRNTIGLWKHIPELSRLARKKFIRSRPVATHNHSEAAFALAHGLDISNM